MADPQQPFETYVEPISDQSLGDMASGMSSYFERPVAEYGVEPSPFEQDIAQQPGRDYGAILPISTDRESGASRLDIAGGIPGTIARGFSTFDRQLSGLPVSDEQLATAAIDVVPTSAGIASIAAGPAMLPGMLGAFSMKHGSGRLFDRFAENPEKATGTAVAGPGTYLGDEEVAVEYARKLAARDPATEDDVAYDVAFPYGVDIEDMANNPQKYNPDLIDDPRLREDSLEALNDVLADAKRRAEKQVIDLQNGRFYYFFEDGSALIRNLKPDMPVLEPRGKGAGYVYDVMVNAEKENFLNFEQPFYKQSPVVREQLNDIRRDLQLGDKDDGRKLFSRLSDELGGDQQATEFLRQKGVVGNIFQQRGKELMVVFKPEDLEIQQTTPYERFADGGVVSLKNRAVNMNRGPRNMGIMQYVPYMTGATNGY